MAGRGKTREDVLTEYARDMAKVSHILMGVTDRMFSELLQYKTVEEFDEDDLSKMQTAAKIMDNYA